MLGFNLTYWEANVIYHVVFSAVIPILVTELTFPDLRGRPYLSRRGLAITSVVAVLGVALLRVTVPPFADPGYRAPLPALLGCRAGAMVGHSLAGIASAATPVDRIGLVAVAAATAVLATALARRLTRTAEPPASAGRPVSDPARSPGRTSR
ncbi:hypothetical protein [Sphaerisporangium fuscum]|uniref:hypothetical protein n=1 Tax=Sphaerisporangium fuscum TaxID=2835868 RepID=UPI001BDC9C0D|nr:hypothetical protein [Sphaerisporangium fuscum]